MNRISHMMKSAQCYCHASYLALFCLALLGSVSHAQGQGPDVVVSPYDALAERYVRLVLAAGEHDKNLVDAYYGPAEWREQARASAATVPGLLQSAERLLHDLAAQPEAPDALTAARQNYLAKQTRAVHARLRMLAGEKLGFDEETALLYDAVAENRGLAYYDGILTQIDQLIPGDAPLAERVQAYRDRFIIPPDRLKSVMDAAIAGCREQTIKYLSLPESEKFALEFVTDQPWSGYNWYQGNYDSLIQINTDLPIYLDRAVDLGCHEGYPGHHTYNMLLERALLREKGWQEFSVYVLFSPQSLIAEGTANLGIDMAFPGVQRMEFERDVLFPLAGLDPALAADYYEFRQLLIDLAFYRNEVARDYLDGRISREQAIEHSIKYGLVSRERAEQSVSFIDTYRGYVINYNLGAEMAGQYVERNGGDSEAARWAAYADLLASPRLPSDLRD